MKAFFNKTAMLVMMILFTVPFITSCDKDDNETGAYFIMEGDMTSNYQHNYYVRNLVDAQILYDVSTGNNIYVGKKKDAITWFNSKCEIMLAPGFTGSSPVLEDTSCTFELLQSVSSTSNEDYPVITSRTITFPASTTDGQQ